MLNSFIWPNDRNLYVATTRGLGGPGNDGNKGGHDIPQSSGITCALPSACFVSYPEHTLEKS